MKKRLYLKFPGILLVFLSLVIPAPVAFAAPGKATMVHRGASVTIQTHRSHCRSHCGPVLNQFFHGNSYSHLYEPFHGHDLNNGGNQGYNVGRNVNYGSNGGNLAISHGRSRYASIHQHFSGNSYSHDTGEFIGSNLNNNGNQGHNRGYNVNYGSNGGNMLVHQGGRSSITQHFSGNSYSHNRAYFAGYNQNNTGNQGWNSGYNEDHGGNGGNQAVN